MPGDPAVRPCHGGTLDNPAMRYPIIVTVSIAALLMVACSPEFNWRQTALTPTNLQAVFPCKPETAVRPVILGGQAMQLHMASCSASGVTVAVGHAAMPLPHDAGAVLRQWRQTTLATMRGKAVGEKAFTIASAPALPDAVSLQALGTGPQGSSLTLHAAWFAQGSTAFVAMVYGGTVRPEVADTFLSGLILR